MMLPSLLMKCLLEETQGQRTARTEQLSLELHKFSTMADMYCVIDLSIIKTTQSCMLCLKLRILSLKNLEYLDVEI